MSIDRIGSGYPGMPAIKRIDQLQPKITDKGQAAEKGNGFKDTLAQAVREMDRLEKDADHRIEDLMVGKNGATPHDAMIALEKADVAFQLMNNIRTRIVQAYQEIVRTQV